MLRSRDKGPRALLSYVTTPFTDVSTTPTHQNHIAARILAERLAHRGYRVDVCDHWIEPPAVDYELALGLEPALVRVLDAGPIKRSIYLATGAHHATQNAAEEVRLDRIRRTRGVSLRPRRTVPPHDAAERSDLVACVGGSWAQNSYRTRGLRVAELHEPSLIPPRNARRAATDRQAVMWLGGSGLVHKGLDLVLEALAGRSDIDVHIVGSIKPERDFMRAFRGELRAPNVVAHGWVDVSSAAFALLCEINQLVVFPSCSEGRAGSVVSAMARGLIPIVTPEAGIDLADGTGWYTSGSVAAVGDAVEAAYATSPLERADRSAACVEYVARRHTTISYATAVDAMLDTVDA